MAIPRLVNLPALFVMILVPAFAIAQESEHEFGGTIWLTTNYMFRGITNSDNDPAIQGELDYSYTSLGFYAFVWGSNIDFDDDSHVEIDYGAGFSNAFDNELEWDVGLIYYSYPDSSIEPDYDYFESYAGITYTFENMPLKPTVGGTFWYTPQFFGEDGDATYFEGNLSLHLPHDFVFSIHAGYQNVDGDKTSGSSGFDYVDFLIDLSKEIVGFNANLSFANTIDQTDACGDTSACEGRVFFTLSRNF